MKVQLPLLGKAAGSYAGGIYQSYFGHTYVRSFPAIFHYPDTQDQQTTQAKFFDVQRSWLPIYQALTQFIGKMQTRNKNPFNVFSKGLYKIFNPYAKKYKFFPLKYFGLDPLNRVRPAITALNVKIDENDVMIRFDLLRPYNDMAIKLKTTHILALNLTQQTLYYANKDLQAGSNEFPFVNTNHWQNGDTVVLYVALSADSWLGNFNLISEWYSK